MSTHTMTIMADIAQNSLNPAAILLRILQTCLTAGSAALQGSDDIWATN
jgi:hypothetical protein